MTLNISIHRLQGAWHVSLERRDALSETAPVHGIAEFVLESLYPLELEPAPYGQELTRQLFGDPQIREAFLRVEAAAEAVEGQLLRVAIKIDPSAQELESLRWELLRHPTKPDFPLATSERVLLSRFLFSHDLRPVFLRARSDLVAVVAVSAPVGPKMTMHPVDWEGEVRRAQAGLTGIKVRVVGGPSEPLTADRLVDAVRGGVDVLYLVSHGRFHRGTGTPLLYLQGADGDVQVVDGAELATRIGELREGPRLVVLASCESAGGDGGPLAARLAKAGVPAVLAMRGQISMETVATMMPVFFQELLVDGQIDRALAVARGHVRARLDAWMPALYSRLRDGRLWYTAGFGAANTEDEQAIWRALLDPVRFGELVPILGPGVQQSVYGSPQGLANKLATRFRYPLAVADREDMPRVHQFVEVHELRRQGHLGSAVQARTDLVRIHKEQLIDEMISLHGHWLPPELVLARQLGPLLEAVADHQREYDPRDPNRLLAALGASVYLTTTPDPGLSRALIAAGRDPNQVLSRWRWGRKAAERTVYPLKKPSREQPLVYHAFGGFGPLQPGQRARDTDDSLVLTEDDCFDYLVGTSREKLTPSVVERALVDSSLLFLGFRLTDWSFRVLFRLMMNLEGRELMKGRVHFAVQLDPELQTMADVEGAKAYLAEYFDQEARIHIFWGSAAEFLAALQAELARHTTSQAQAEVVNGR